MVNSVDSNKNNALHINAKRGSLEITEFIVEKHGFDFFNISNDLGRNAFLISAEVGELEKMKYFIQKQPNIIDSVDSENFNALHLSAQFGTLDGSKFLVEQHGFDIRDSSNKFNQSSIELSDSEEQSVYFRSLL